MSVEGSGAVAKCYHYDNPEMYRLHVKPRVTIAAQMTKSCRLFCSRDILITLMMLTDLSVQIDQASSMTVIADISRLSVGYR
jgi:hypothetical protein